MFKLLRRLICLALIAVAGFLVVSYLYGGEGFRWFGKSIKEKSDKAAKTADRIKETTEGVKNTTEKYQRAIENRVGGDD